MNQAACVAAAILLASALQASAQGSAANALSDFSEDQKTYLGRLGNALSASRNCDFAINNEAIKTTAKPIFGSDEFSPAKAFNMLYVVDGFSGMADSMLFPRGGNGGKAKECAEMLRLFGPSGTVLKGILKP